MEAASGQGRGPAGLQGDHNRARSTGPGFCMLGAASSALSISQMSGCLWSVFAEHHPWFPTPLPGCILKTSLCSWRPIYGETEALGGCVTPPPLTPAAPPRGLSLQWATEDCLAGNTGRQGPLTQHTQIPPTHSPPCARTFTTPAWSSGVADGDNTLVLLQELAFPKGVLLYHSPDRVGTSSPLEVSGLCRVTPGSQFPRLREEGS